MPIVFPGCFSPPRKIRAIATKHGALPAGMGHRLGKWAVQERNGALLRIWAVTKKNAPFFSGIGRKRQSWAILPGDGP
jgi:hypothetical protein